MLQTQTRSHVALIAHWGEHCTDIAEVVGLNPVQSLIFSGLCFSSVTSAFAFDICMNLQVFTIFMYIF